jgi:hypothetical protein
MSHCNHWGWLEGNSRNQAEAEMSSAPRNGPVSATAVLVLEHGRIVEAAHPTISSATGGRYAAAPRLGGIAGLIRSYLILGPRLAGVLVG